MTNPNEPAYPSVKSKSYPNHKGISRREYFAAKAMQGFLANGWDPALPYSIIADCYKIADIMIELGSAE